MSDETPPVSEPTSASAAPVARPAFSVSLSARDLLNVAIFAVIYFVVVYAINMLGLINPVVMVLALLLSVIAAGVPFMLFLTRVRHAGMVTLFGLLIGVVYGLTGLGWTTAVVALVVSVIAEVILWVGRYRSRWAAIGACAVFSGWYIGPMIPLLIDREEYLNSPAMEGVGDQYVADFDQLVTVPVLWGFNVATIVCGLIGGILGAVLLKKHFVRAGLA